MAFDPGVDVLDAVDPEGAGWDFGAAGEAGRGQEDNIAGFGEGVQALQGDEVNGGPVAGDVFETVGAEDETIAGLTGLLTRLPGLVVGSYGCRHAKKEADQAGNGAVGREGHVQFLEDL